MGRFLNTQISCRNYAYEHGTDRPDVANWVWPHDTRKAA
jgi:phosphoketolase